MNDNVTIAVTMIAAIYLNFIVLCIRRLLIILDLVRVNCTAAVELILLRSNFFFST